MHLLWLKTERELLPHWRSALNVKSNRKRKLHGSVIFSIHRKAIRHIHSLPPQDPKASFLLLFFRFCTAWFLAPSCSLDRCMGNWWRFSASPFNLSHSWDMRLMISRASFHPWRKELNLPWKPPHKPCLVDYFSIYQESSITGDDPITLGTVISYYCLS